MRIAILILVAALTIACNTKANVPATSILGQLQAQQTPTEKPAKQVHLCGATNKDGTHCKRHVKAEGLRCWMHQGK